jgi:CRP-like cAMP-binding protein
MRKDCLFQIRGETEMDIRNLFKNDTNIFEYSPADTIFEQGTPGDKMYVIMDGTVDIQCNGKSIAKAGPGETIGELALVDKEYRCACAVSIDKTKLVEIDERRFQFLIQQNPFFALKVMKMMADRIRTMDKIAGQK